MLLQTERQKVKVKLLSRVQLLVTPWTAAYQALPSMGFSRQEYWSGVLLAANSNKSFLLPIFGLIVSVGLTATERQTHFSDNSLFCGNN